VRTVVRGKNLDVPEKVRRYAIRKLGRLDRIVDERSEAIVDLAIERHRSAAQSHIVEVTLVVAGRPIRGRAQAATHEAGIDQVVDKVERRAVDHKRKPRLRARPTEEKEILRRIADGTAEPDRERRIVKTKRFDIEPMFEEDALAAMDELGHSFFIFVNAETERLNVLYRRTDGDLGLIEPLVAGEYTPTNGRRPERRAARS
jgi:putative sigma-54 modulation protein